MEFALELRRTNKLRDCFTRSSPLLGQASCCLHHMLLCECDRPSSPKHLTPIFQKSCSVWVSVRAFRSDVSADEK